MYLFTVFLPLLSFFTFLLFQISGIILLVAMIGSILLTLRKREGVKKQSIHKQTLKK